MAALPVKDRRIYLSLRQTIIFLLTGVWGTDSGGAPRTTGPSAERRADGTNREREWTPPNCRESESGQNGMPPTPSFQVEPNSPPGGGRIEDGHDGYEW